MNTISQLSRFLVVGVIGTLLLLTGTYILTEFMHLWYLWAFVISAVCNWTFLFFAHNRFTFKPTQTPGVRNYGLFLILYFAAFLLNTGLIYVLTTLLSLQYLISIVLATGFTTLITFILNKTVIFRNHHEN